MDEEKLIKLEHFFEVDVRIKKLMYDVAPSNIKYFDEYTMRGYRYELRDMLTYIFSELKCIAIDIFGKDSNVFLRIKYLENVIRNNFNICGFDINKFRSFYMNYISNMGIDFINSVKSECIGYSSGGTRSIEKAVSINEILHFIHSYIVNNDKIIRAIPLLDQKNNKYNYPITLRGIKVPEFEQLFKQFPIDLDVAWTDMVTITENKLIMMVRDRGHALSIEITLNNNRARIEYFIPKLCNIEMINMLPGVNRVSKESIGATGIIDVPINDLSSSLFDFISKVPTDDDIIYENEKMV